MSSGKGSSSGPDDRTPHDAPRKPGASSGSGARALAPLLGLLRRFRKAIWFLAGAIAFLLGLAGMILPAVPGVVFLIVAAACFARSSPRFERWLVEHAYLGPPIRHWRATGSIPRKAKWLAIGSMTVSLAGIAWIAPPVAAVASAAGMIAAAAFILTRPDA